MKDKKQLCIDFCTKCRYDFACCPAEKNKEQCDCYDCSMDLIECNKRDK